MYIKPGPNYRMSSQAKRFASLILDPHKRGEFLRSTVQAELAAEVKIKERKKNEPDLGSDNV
jgi:hypothetical protein